MEILTIKTVSKLWNISPRRIAVLCEQGRIIGAEKVAGVWLLPPDCKKPSDARIKNGNYMNWRTNKNMSVNDYQGNLKNLRGTFAVEGMSLSERSVSNLERLVSNKNSYAEIIEEIKKKYMQRI